MPLIALLTIVQALCLTGVFLGGGLAFAGAWQGFVLAGIGVLGIAAISTAYVDAARYLATNGQGD